jgi:hypothetical protein
MTRFLSCLAVSLLAASSLRAGELDAEFASQTSTPAVHSPSPGPVDFTPPQLSTPDLTRATTGRELDAETPTQAWRHFGWGGGWGLHRGFGWGGFGGGWGRGFGWGGWGLGGWGLGGWGLGGLGYGGYGGWGGYGGHGGWGGYGGYGGYGLYSSYYPSFGYGFSRGWGCW